jgi:hypothetical protein
MSSPLSSVLTVLGESGAEILFLVVIVWSSEMHSSLPLFTSDVSTLTMTGLSSVEFDFLGFLGDSGATF